MGGANEKNNLKAITEKERTLKIHLSDKDADDIIRLTGAHDITVEYLVESIIADLIHGAHTNGSDERMYAEQWFNRCWFGMFPEETFLKHLIEWDYIDEFGKIWKEIKESEASIKRQETELATGVMEDWKGKSYTWKDIFDSDGVQAYASREEWESYQHLTIEEEKQFIADRQEMIKEVWEDYKESRSDWDGSKPGTFEEEMEKVLKWLQEYERFMGEEI
ncbi:hypothetical protein ABXS75_10930 [Roseburia hominis]